MAADKTTGDVLFRRLSAPVVGLWAALVTAVSAAVALGVAIMTPPRSGSFCTRDCITAPYTDVARFVPRDYLWMYPACLMLVSFVVLVACVHQSVAESRRVFSLVGLSFAMIAATVAMMDYGVQLAVVQPSLLMGQGDGLSLFSMYNPHGVVIALEDLAYLVMGLSFLSVTGALPAVGGVLRATRITFLVAGVLAIVSLVGLASFYRRDLGYRYEVAAISIDWLALTVSGVLLAIAFRRGAFGDHPGYAGVGRTPP
jgi:hypothetical protein